MFLSKNSALFPVLLASSVLGHGQVHSFITSTKTYPVADAYSGTVDPNSPVRKLDTYGPAAPFTGPAITCGSYWIQSGGNNPAAIVAPVVAGSSVTFDWGAWTSVHPGPVMTYIAACPNGCANFKGDTGNVWVKIQQDGYVPTRTPAWAEELIEAGGANGHGTWTVPIPSSLPNGEYILRHEILGLHLSFELNGAQFYPNCVQISVTGGGNVPLPSGVAFPGAYQPTDPGIYLWLYTITPSNATYVIPGGPVLYPPGGSSGSTTKISSTTSKASSTTSSTTSKSSSTTSKASSTTSSTTKASSSTTKASSSTSSSASGTVAKYGQCGGTGWTGATACVAGTTCTVVNAYYYQCL